MEATSNYKTLSTAEKIEAAKALVVETYHRRDQFLSDDDLLDAADAVCPLHCSDDPAVDIWSREAAGDVEAIVTLAEHSIVVEALDAWLSEEA